jgi:hypothetical protein
MKNRDIGEALKWCTTNNNKLTKLNSNIRFKLIKQQFVEIYKSGNILEGVKYARDNFANLNNQREIEEIMILLAIKRENIKFIPKINVRIYNIVLSFR